MDSYKKFLTSKRILARDCGIDSASLIIHQQLFDYQQAAVKRALAAGKFALFEECGLGKTLQQIEWARHVERHTERPVLIFAPLAVAEQTIRESRLINAEVYLANSQKEVVNRGVYVTNYQKLHLFDATVFGGVVLDESSILKHHEGAYRSLLIDSFSRTPFKLCCTATPSPNDFVELGNHAEFLDVMTRAEMLATFFVHDGGSTQDWRLKRHAVRDFWSWVGSWSICCRYPRDMGFEHKEFNLPAINYVEHIVAADISGNGEMLFALPASSLSERRDARHRSFEFRIERAIQLVKQSDGPVVIWCHTNLESETLTEAIANAVEVTGSDSDEHKTKSILDFSDGKIPVLISKPSICGWGVNWQVCHTAIFVSLSDSFEQLYQAVRRIWRFGQQRAVTVHLIASPLEDAVMRNIRRKAEQHEEMMSQMVKHVSKATIENRQTKAETQSGEHWKMCLGDCVELCREIPDDSVHYSIFSPPFASLYTYSQSERDMGNTREHEEFFEHFKFLVAELQRVLMAGRLVSVHCMNLPTSKERDGYIGIADFRGEIIRSFQQFGFIYHSEVCIWKDPVTAMQRTKALGLLHKQLKKDSCMSRQGIADYLVTFRKPGSNPEPVTHTNESFPVDLWQRWASPIWMDINASDTLQKESAREFADERHIAPLQLEVIARAVQLWTNEYDLVLSPFAGIGSEGYEAIKLKRRFLGFELKRSYFEQACANLQRAEEEQRTLFSV